MESTFNIKEFLKALRKRLPLIIMVTLLFVALSGVVSYTMMQPVYKASTQILVNQNNTAAQPFNTQNIDANIQLISTYNVIIKSPIILAAVIEELGLNETTTELDKRITVSNIENSQVVTLDVEDTSIEKAVLIANTTASVFQAEIKNLMKVDNVNILAQAVVPIEPEPVKPDPLFNMGVGAIIGFMLGTGLAILLDQMNTTVRTEEDIEAIVGLHVLGIVSRTDNSKEERRTIKAKNKKEVLVNVENEKVKPIGGTKVGRSY